MGRAASRVVLRCSTWAKGIGPWHLVAVVCLMLLSVPQASAQITTQVKIDGVGTLPRLSPQPSDTLPDGGPQGKAPTLKAHGKRHLKSAQNTYSQEGKKLAKRHASKAMEEANIPIAPDEAQQLLHKAKRASQHGLTDELKEALPPQLSALPTMDSTTLHQATERLEQEAADKAREYVAEQVATPEQMMAEMFPVSLPGGADVASSSHIKSMLLERGTRNTAREQMAANLPKLESAFMKVEEARHKKPVIGKFDNIGQKPTPIKERWSYGGNMLLALGQESQVHLTPWAGYKLTKITMVGVGAGYQSYWEQGGGIRPVRDHAIDGRAFAEVIFFKELYLHLEGERVQLQQYTEQGKQTSTHNHLLIGLGRAYAIKGRLHANLQLLYNLHHTADGPYPRPLVVRFGVMVK